MQQAPRNRLLSFPYIIHILQKLEECDYEARVELFNRYRENIELVASFNNRVILSDKDVSHVNEKVDEHKVKIS